MSPEAALTAAMTLPKVTDREREDASPEEVAAKMMAGMAPRLTAEQKAAKVEAEIKLKKRYADDLNQCHQAYIASEALTMGTAQINRSIQADQATMRAAQIQAFDIGFRQGFNRGRLLTDLDNIKLL